MSDLVLSLFPGIGLLDMAFEEEDFCVVRGPDLLWGGDIKKFHPPAGKFDGVIGGPPCQRWSKIATLNTFQGRPLAECLIPEFERCVKEARPKWFLMENVSKAPTPQLEGYCIYRVRIKDVHCGGETKRIRDFCFGAPDPVHFEVIGEALHRPDPEITVTARATVWDPGKNRARSAISNANVRKSLVLQGLPDTFLDHAPFTVEGKQKVIGNAVPLAMGRSVAQAVRRALA